MTLTGHSLIAGQPVAGTGKTAYGFNPATNEQLDPAYSLISEDQLTTATSAAAAAYPSFSSLAPETHAAFLDAIADNIDAIGEELALRASQETGLPAVRLQGERARTTGQLRLFASVVRQGDFRGVRIDRRSLTRPRCQGPISASARSRSAQSRSSAPATSRWPSRRRAETRPPPSPPAVRSSSKPTTPTPAPANSSATPS
jgi:acyl-CoA reductase-like NAD-dependent aldehyde dehydrogenase